MSAIKFLRTLTEDDFLDMLLGLGIDANECKLVVDKDNDQIKLEYSVRKDAQEIWYYKYLNDFGIRRSNVRDSEDFYLFMLERFGKEYLDALTSYYDDPALIEQRTTKLKEIGWDDDYIRFNIKAFKTDINWLKDTLTNLHDYTEQQKSN